MDHSTNPNLRPGPERNLAYLREMAQLRRTEASCDLSEVSYQTEQTDFPNSRHSSINAEPLTLDAEQIHNAKDEAADVLQHADSETVFGVFTKGCLNALNGRVSMMEYFWRQGQDLCVKSDESFSPESPESEVLAQQLSALVEKVQEAADGNQQAYVKSPPDTPDISLLREEYTSETNLDALAVDGSQQTFVKPPPDAFDISLLREEDTLEMCLDAVEKSPQREGKMSLIDKSDVLEIRSQLEENSPKVSAPVALEIIAQLEEKRLEARGSSSKNESSADENGIEETLGNGNTLHPVVFALKKDFKKEEMSFQN